MQIFKDYTTSDVLFDVPFIGNNLKLYPIKVRDYKNFEKFTKYFIFSKRHYKLGNDANLFEFIIAVGISTYNEFYLNKKQKKTNEELLHMILTDFELVFKIICREDITYDRNKLSENGEVEFTNEDRNIIIGRNNFELIRQIVLKQNALREPKIFDNITEERLAQKYIKAHQSRRNDCTISELGEIANLISCVTGKSYEYLYNQNIMQLYSDYFRCISIESYKANILFMTVSDKVNPSDYTEDVVSKLFADPYENMWKDKSSIGILN